MFVWIYHDDVIKWKHFPRHWYFIRGILRSAVDSPHKGQWGGALVFSSIYTWTNGWTNNGDASDLRRYRPHNDVTEMHLMIAPVPVVGIIGRSLTIRNPLQWRHNERDRVSNHQPRDCLLNRLFTRRSKKYQSYASLAFVWEIHRWPVNSPHKGPVTRKMFPFDDVIMTTKWKPFISGVSI